jgi:8-oxo-dGTP pyrophosphatase MutT (NUDIX family)
MAISEYLKGLRSAVGSELVLLPGVAAIIHDEAGHVLVVRTLERSHPWSLPAGSIEPGETPRQAVVREVLEETGLQVFPAELLDVLGGSGFRVVYNNGDQVEYTVCAFRCEVVGGRLHCDGDETTESRWVPPDQVGAMVRLPYPALLFARPGSGPAAGG